MARKTVRGIWIVSLFLSTTLVFWGLLQNQPQLDGHGMPSQNQIYQRLSAGILADKRTGNSLSQIDAFKSVSGGSSPSLKAPKSNRLWPNRLETEDRILPQINLIPKNANFSKRSEMKLILLNNGFPSGITLGDAKFRIDGCPVRNCYLTDDRRRHAEAHAIVFDGGMYQVPYEDRPRSQIWVLYLLESPENVADLRGQKNVYNWTATYRVDSTINTPYERFIPYANATQDLPIPKRNYAKGKSKLAAWFVSNCYTTNRRFAYAKALQQYMDVEIYGSCGNKTCFRSEKQKCNQILNEDYKFYLAFENSNCKDYITEKLYWNALYNDVIPVVMGARPEDYAAVSPPGSYIHVDDFESPRHLADYLLKLDQNDTLYNEYFRWKGTGEFIDTKYWCRLCSMVHETYNSESFSMWYDDIAKWWNGPGVCIRPRADQPWASWKTGNGTGIKIEDVISGPDTLRRGLYTSN